MKIRILLAGFFVMGWTDLAQAHPKRIVTLAPVLSEWVSEILGEPVAQEVIVGVSEYSKDPAFLKSKPTVGPYPQIQIEKVLSLKPDLILASEEYNRKEQLDQLRRLKLNLKVLKKESFLGMRSWIRILGQTLGEPAKAKQALRRWQKELHSIQAKPESRGRYFIEVQHEPLISVGGGSFITEALAWVGFENVFKGIPQGYPKVSVESVMKENPDWIFILDHVGGDEEIARSKAGWNRFPNLRAVKSRHVVTLSGEDYARCTLRLLNALKKLDSAHEE